MELQALCVVEGPVFCARRAWRVKLTGGGCGTIVFRKFVLDGAGEISSILARRLQSRLGLNASVRRSREFDAERTEFACRYLIERE